MTPMTIQFEATINNKSIFGTIDCKYHFNVHISYNSRNDREDIVINWDYKPKNKEYRDRAELRILRLIDSNEKINNIDLSSEIGE
tara:strand:- start:367 stop:621 length:255 start_codon:yes stop_codon:yes gene_type:complete